MSLKVQKVGVHIEQFSHVQHTVAECSPLRKCATGFLLMKVKRSL